MYRDLVCRLCGGLSLVLVACLSLAGQTKADPTTDASCADLLQFGNASDAKNALDTAIAAKDNKGVVCYILNTQAKNADIFSFDYGVPHSPALMLAGLSPDKVTPSTSLKAFALSLPGLIGSDSTATSAALDFAPAWALADDGDSNVISYSSAGSYWERVLYRTRISGAISKGVDGGSDPSLTKPSRLAFGVNVSLLSYSDPVMASGANDGGDTHWLHCLKGKLDVITPYVPPADTRFYDISDAIAKIDSLILPDDTDFSSVPALSGAKRQRLNQVEAVADRVLGRPEPWSYPAAWDDARMRNEALKALHVQLHQHMSAIMQTPDWVKADNDANNAINACAQEASNLAQKGADLQIGAGIVMQGPGGGSNWTDFKDPNGVVWIAGKLPFDIDQSGVCESPASGAARNEASCWVFGGSGRYSAGESVATGNAGTPFFKANVLEGWFGLERIDSRSKFGAYVGYIDQAAVETAGRPFAKSGTRWLISGAYSLAGLNDAFNGLWIVGSYGAANGSTTTLDDKVALLTLTYAPPTITSAFRAK